MAEEKENYYLFKRVNKTGDGGFALFIDGDMLEKFQKVKFTAVRRDNKNTRTDLAVFFMDYRVLRAIIAIISSKLTSYGIEATYNQKFHGGDDGGRKLGVGLKTGQLTFFFDDKIIQTKKPEFKDYTGEMMFALKGALDLQEFFDLRETLNNWELTQIGRLVHIDTPETETKE